MTKEIQLKYGCNPNQKPSRIYALEGELPVEVLSGKPGYINFLDALNAWQLVKELSFATGKPAAASFKHVSPAGAALGVELTDIERKMFFVTDEELSPIASAYVRARGTDRVSSYGDFIALSTCCDESCARQIAKEVSDGVIAPSYTEKALEILRAKRKGGYTVIQIDENYVPAQTETKIVYGIAFEQRRNDFEINKELLANVVTENKEIPEEAKDDLMLALITLKYTQSNSVCYASHAQTTGVGAGQQSRILCTRLAGEKNDKWHLRQHPKVLSLEFVPTLSRSERDNTIDVYLSETECMDVLGDDVWQNYFTTRPERLTYEEKTEFLSKIDGVCLASDAFFPFGDNIERAHKSGVKYIAQPGGSVRDDNVIDTCNKYSMAMAFTGMRLFHH